MNLILAIMAMLSLCGLSDDTLFKSKCEVEENEAFETFRSDNTVNQMNLYSLPGNVSVNHCYLDINETRIDKYPCLIYYFKIYVCY